MFRTLQVIAFFFFHVKTMCVFASLDSLMDEYSRGLNIKKIHISFNRIEVDVPFIRICTGLHDLLSDKFSYV